MSAKAALKAAKSALDTEDYDTAIKEAQKALSADPQNYFAKLFQGRAFEKQGQLDDAARSYESAAKSKPEDSQAWLGLCSLYEAQGSQRVDEYREAAVKVAEIFGKVEDRHRCQVAIDKLVAFSKQHGTKAQYKKALEVLLPESPIYDFLEGRIPHPSNTYTRLSEITEDEEASIIKQEISNRRTRIGARVGQVTTDVKREVYAKSQLESLYQEIINWSNNDEVRREYEQKLLERAYEVLMFVPIEEKGAKLDQVLNLAEGMVIIHHPFQLAWDLVLETRDLDDLRDLDANILREYISHFTDSGLAKILKGWITSELSPFPPVEDEDEDNEQPAKQITPEDRLLLFTEGLQTAGESPFAYRLVGDYYLQLEENESAADTARSGLKVLMTESEKLGMSMQNTKDAMNSVLATALVHHQAPRNHGEARRLFNDILQRKPRWTAALIGLGLVFEENEDYEDAISFLSRALEESNTNIRVGTELAWCRALNGDYARAQRELEDYLPQIKADDPRARDLRAQVLYRIGMCMWKIDTSKAARKDRNGAYARFLSAIKTNVSFAPAYTSLGIYYSEYARDKKRGRQCFQKAFVLSPAETYAAELLARSFADQGDWDIVEVIAQRVVDSGRARPPPGSKRKGLSWPYSALGVVQMNKQEYQLSITSFLAALRISPDDYQSYVGLGESYHNSGRYNSALRTFKYALEPHDGIEMKAVGDTWFARYMLANVHRELGDYDEAVAGLREVLSERPGEFGALMSLLQTYVEQSNRCVETGLYGQAIESANEAIKTAVNVAKDRPNAFNMWKAVGDSCMIFSLVQSGTERMPKEDLDALLTSNDDSSTYKALDQNDKIDLEALSKSRSAVSSSETPLFYPIIASILAYKRAIHCSAHDIHAQAVAWYNLGWAEQRAHSCTSSFSPKFSIKYLKTAVRCFKRAVELEAGNAEFWNALGVVTTTLNPKVAQHAFVRSLHINELNAKVWTNLGVLYLFQNDHELAHKAFGRAQSTDPEYAHAWVGEGLIALLVGGTKEALSHFTHAFEISDPSSLISKRQYATSTFDHLLTVPTASNDLTALIQPIFSLEQLCLQVPHDLPYRHLAANFSERVGNHAAAIETLTSLCEAAESEYETSESLAALARFARAKSDLARNQLAAHDFNSAAENAETALDLSSDEDNSGLDVESRTKLRLSAHLTAGLAQYHLLNSSSAIEMFKTALQESTNDPEVICTLVKVLWAHGKDDEKSVARDQLLECIEQHPEHIGAITLLAATSALDSDAETTDAVTADLISLRTKDGLELQEQTAISSLLSALGSLCSDPNDEDGMIAAQEAINLNPSHPQPWRELADLSGETYAAEMALKTAQQFVPPVGDMDAQDLTQAFAGVGTAADAQRAIVHGPWAGAGWEALGEVLN